MSERQSPVLVHNRIEKNHRSTIILLALVPLVLLPYAAGIAMWWRPWWRYRPYPMAQPP
jgi:hypothetical protein